jgi:hypothetical protein
VIGIEREKKRTAFGKCLLLDKIPPPGDQPAFFLRSVTKSRLEWIAAAFARGLSLQAQQLHCKFL